MTYNEAETRFHLIDPILRQKGYDDHQRLRLETPAPVEPTGPRGRRRRGSGRTDYLLCVRVGEMPRPLPVAVLEAKNRVAKRMRLAGLRSKIRRNYRVTTNSKHDFPIAPNRLERNFTAAAPDKVWVSDITYLATRSGWLYLTVIIDLFSRMVVGWALSSSLSHEMVVTALKRAIRSRHPAKGLTFHSDRGVQYACTDFRNELDAQGFIQSMSRKGDCWDNAVAESFFGIMKTELVYHEKYEGRQDTLHSIFEYIEAFYNRQRRHSALGYLSPAEYEKQKLKLCA
jgi:transposase InsO family protein